MYATGKQESFEPQHMFDTATVTTTTTTTSTISRCQAYHFVGDRSAMEQQGPPQEQPAEICPGEPETGVVEEARAEPQPAVTQTAASKGYQKKRSTFTVPDGYEKVNVVDILKPKPGSAVSAVWQHVDTYAKAAEPTQTSEIFSYTQKKNICRRPRDGGRRQKKYMSSLALRRSRGKKYMSSLSLREKNIAL